MNSEKIRRSFPWIMVGCTVLYLGLHMWPPRDKENDWHFRRFGCLPVLEGGRYKPMDTVARTKLMIITHRQTYYDAKAGEYYPANRWLLDLMTSPATGDRVMNFVCPNGAKTHPAWDYKVFRIENNELVRNLGLTWREGLRYSINEISHNMEYLDSETKRISKIEAKDRSLLETKLMELSTHLQICMELSSNFAPRVVPDAEANQPWKPFHVAFMELLERTQDGEEENPASAETVKTYFELLRHYDQGDKTAFNALLAGHLAKLERQSPSMMRAIYLEVFFNEFAPFFQCLVLYVLIAVIGALSWVTLSWSQPLRQGAYLSMGIVFCVHVAAILTRMYLQGKAPVTNLYSSAIFISMGCVAICLVVEWFYKTSLAIVVGSVTGFCTLFIAHWLSLDGDTIETLIAVLDTNFWLATHVTCVTLGYTTTFVAGFMGIAYIFLGIFTNLLRKNGSADLARMTYGVLCAGMFLSFVGTVLGGLWADYSWGRFWGWDPKENGALLIVLWIALILHARWGGMVKQRGLAVMSVLGMIVTSWSWFGTNFLGVGLHSYGFRQGAMTTLLLIDLGILAIAGLGLLPLHLWQSFSPPRTTMPKTPVAPSVASRPKPANV